MKKISSPLSCRDKCGACCIAPSISTPMPGMPQGKPTGVPCFHLDDNMRCKLFNSHQRPLVCHRLQPELTMCGENRQQALTYLYWLENMTSEK